MTLRSAACTPTCPGDLYVVVRLRVAEGEESIALDTEELLDARWMSAEEVEARCETAEDEGKPLAGKVSRGNWEMIRHALEGAPIHRRSYNPTCIQAVSRQYSTTALRSAPSQLYGFTCTRMCPGALIEGVTVPSSKGVPTMLYRASGLSAPPVGSKAGTDGTIPALASAAGCAPPVVVGGAVVDVVCLPDKGTALLPRTSTPGHLETTSGGVARNVADGMVRRDGLQPHVTGAATPCDRAAANVTGL